MIGRGRSSQMEREFELQERNLGELSESVSRLSRLSLQIRNELDDQNEELLQLERGMDENLEGMSLVSRQTSALINQAGELLTNRPRKSLHLERRG